MKPTRAQETIDSLIDTRWPVFIWGPPGVGKSSVVQKIARDKKLELLDIRASLLDPTDLRGIPTVDKGQAKWCPPSFLPHDPESKGILFFDELNAARHLYRQAFINLPWIDGSESINYPKDGESFAGNKTDRAVVNRIPSH